MLQKTTIRVAMSAAALAAAAGVLVPTSAQAAPAATKTATTTTASDLAGNTVTPQAWSDWVYSPDNYWTQAAANTALIAAIQRLQRIGYDNAYTSQVYARSEWLNGAFVTLWAYRFRYWG